MGRALALVIRPIVVIRISIFDKAKKACSDIPKTAWLFTGVSFLIGLMAAAIPALTIAGKVHAYHLIGFTKNSGAMPDIVKYMAARDLAFIFDLFLAGLASQSLGLRWVAGMLVACGIGFSIISLSAFGPGILPLPLHGLLWSFTQ